MKAKPISSSYLRAHTWLLVVVSVTLGALAGTPADVAAARSLRGDIKAAQARESRALERLKTLVLELEAGFHKKAIDRHWFRRRSSWRSQLQGAKTATQLAKHILTLEAALRSRATSSLWRKPERRKRPAMRVQWRKTLLRTSVRRRGLVKFLLSLNDQFYRPMAFTRAFRKRHRAWSKRLGRLYGRAAITGR